MKSKKQKRTEAIARQEAYNKLSRAERLQKLNDGGFRAVKERIRNGYQLLSELAIR